MVKRRLLALNEHLQGLGDDWNPRDAPEVERWRGGGINSVMFSPVFLIDSNFHFSR